MNASNILDRHSNRRLNAVTILQRHTRKENPRDYSSSLETVQAGRIFGDAEGAVEIEGRKQLNRRGVWHTPAFGMPVVTGTTAKASRVSSPAFTSFG